MRIDVITLFPEFFESGLSVGLIGKAIGAGIAEVHCVDPRTFTTDPHRTVDDTPYGGGAGMVMKVEPLRDAIADVRRSGGPVVMMTPQGETLRQAHLERWSRGSHVALVCGRYEGFDERVRALVDEEVSLGDFVLTGGEYAALAIIDGVVRLREGTLGNATSAEADSFSDGLLEHPQYTRPVDLDGRSVPEILRSGDHEKIRTWRHQQALERTLERRPDLFMGRGATRDERAYLVSLARPEHAVSLVVGFSSAPDPATLTALARLAVAYGVRRVHVVGPADEALRSAPVARAPRPLTTRESKKRSKRQQAQEIEVDPRAVLQILSDPSILTGMRVAVGGELDLPVLPPKELRRRDVLLLLGPTQLAAEARFPELRTATSANDLPLLSAAGVVLDRIIGEG